MGFFLDHCDGYSTYGQRPDRSARKNTWREKFLYGSQCPIAFNFRSIGFSLSGRAYEVCHRPVGSDQRHWLTIINNVSDIGHHSFYGSYLFLNDTSSQVIVFTVVLDERVEPILAALSALAGSSLDGLHPDWVYCPNNVESCFAHVRCMTEYQRLCLPPDDHTSDRPFRHSRTSPLGKSWHGSVTASRAVSVLCLTAS